MLNQDAWWQQGAARETWYARYEQLRAGWLAQEIGWGQALFIHQGMAAWMKAWSTAMRHEPETRADASASERAGPQVEVLPDERQRQLTCALVNLILHRQQEVLA